MTDEAEQVLALLRLLYVESHPETRASATATVNQISARYERLGEREKAQQRLAV